MSFIPPIPSGWELIYEGDLPWVYYGEKADYGYWYPESDPKKRIRGSEWDYIHGSLEPTVQDQILKNPGTYFIGRISEAEEYIRRVYGVSGIPDEEATEVAIILLEEYDEDLEETMRLIREYS